MYRIPTVLRDEIDYIKNSSVISIQCSNDIGESNLNNRSVINKLSGKQTYIFSLREEVIHTDEILQDLIKTAKEKSLDFKILSSTSTEFEHTIHPLVSLTQWNGNSARNQINWDFDDTIVTFKKDTFDFAPTSNHREYKGILSVRKNNPTRNMFFNKDVKINDGIVRYANWPNFGNETSKLLKTKSKFPTFLELIEEYKNSLFSFIMETSEPYNDNNNTKTHHNSLSEKTILAFLSGTMPIVLGGSGYVKELTEMGFKVWNNDFGFSNADERDDYDKVGLDYFYECLNQVNTMTLNAAKKYWDTYKKDIQHNFDIISTYVLNNELNIFNK